MKLGIFTIYNDEYKYYISACEELGIDYEVVDILSADWIDNVRQSDCDAFLCTSTCGVQIRKTILDERLYFISEEMGKFIYPSFQEIYIHENKRNMAAWLEINGFPHSKTNVFTSYKEAKSYLSECDYPIVVKSSFGAGASKVKIVKTKSHAMRLARSFFPMTKFTFLKSGHLYWLKLKGIPVPDFANRQAFYMLVQEYLPIKWEWRIIKIGDSFFGHQKLLKGQFASGSGKVGWVRPPVHLFDMVDDLTKKGGFYSMAMDVFETTDGKFYINEIQSMFGSYLDSQMFIDEKPGRFIKVGGEYVFEEGYFNTHCSRLLRVKHLVDLLQNNKLTLKERVADLR